MKVSIRPHRIVHMRPTVSFRLTLIAGFLFLASAPLFAQSEQRTILDGVYTAEQATRGRAAYDILCSRCHGGEGFGPVRASDLTSPDFIDNWREYDLGFMYSMILSDMPPDSGQEPSPEQVVDIIPYILQRNAYPTGDAELTADELPGIRFVGPEGPQEVASGSLAFSVGCLTEVGAGQWSITNATEARRTERTTSTPDTRADAARMPLGNHEYRVVNFNHVREDYDPARYAGFKMLVTGYLIRQTDSVRFNLTDINLLTGENLLGIACTP